MCRTWTSLCSWGMESDSLFLTLSFFLLSALLSVPIPLALVQFSFSHSPCISSPPKGIAVGHIVSLLPLSALSIPLLHSSCLRGCLFKPLPTPHPPLLPAFASFRLTRVCAKYCLFMLQDGLSSAPTAAGSPKSKYHIML